MNKTAQVFKRIQQIEVYTRKLVEELLAGAWKSVFKGQGLEFEDVQKYVPGDDVRLIDWNVTARMNEPFIKRFREERELTVMLLIDVSSSCFFGTKEVLKNELIAEIAATLAFSAIKNQDRVGAILFSNEIEQYVPPRKGKRHVLRLIRDILLFQPKKRGTSIQKVLDFLGNVMHKPAICFLFSDFLTEENYTKALNILSKRHDMVLMQIQDPFESSPIPFSLIHLRDLESGEERHFDIESNHKQQQAATEKRQKKLEEMAKTRGIDLVKFNTDESFQVAIERFFKGRKKR